MFGQSLVRAAGLVRNARYFRSNLALRDVKQVSTPTNVAAQTPKTPDPEQVIGAKMRRVSNFDRWMLVWMKKFPSKEQVPDKITLDLYHKAQSQARIKTANLMMVFTILGCIAAVISGKRDARSGKSMSEQNEDWHKQINAEFKASQAAAAAASKSS